MIKGILGFLLLIGGAYLLLLVFTFFAKLFLPKQRAEAIAFWTWAALMAVGWIAIGGGTVSSDLLGRRN